LPISTKDIAVKQESIVTSIPSTNNGTQSNGKYLHLSCDWDRKLAIKPFSIPLSDDAPCPRLTTRNAPAKKQCDEKKAESLMGSEAKPTKPKSPNVTTYKAREQLIALLVKDGTVKLQSYALAKQIEMNEIQLTSTKNSIKPIIQNFSHPERNLYNYLTKELRSKWIDDPHFVSKDIANRARIAAVAVQATVAKKIKEFAVTLAQFFPNKS
jgi:hypothetical protein